MNFKKYKIAYITRVDVSSYSAQAIQIKCMARAFCDILGSPFLLICSGQVFPNYGIVHRILPFANIRHFRYIGVCLCVATRSILRRDQLTYTRDIMVAAVVTALGGRAVFEAHNAPKGIFSKYLA
jgi:hypothetical protein